ncbi:hypothetical protein LTR84_012501 [Exophiala bonariae]|uniref:AB hydrolase-1 domain-containing protein n=1 Tax=Exophiala bonariae TaxID=1690606 RepID=A0AAV9NED2_9EURO|nr:hypothetical protein LTR84_012501 [Exophiala bonariae]
MAFLSSFIIALTLKVSITGAVPTPRDAPQYSIDWQPCAENATENPASLDCGHLEVPMDWNNPDGTKIRLAVSRVKTNSTNKLGSLFFNPGGPGGPALPLCVSLAVEGDIAFNEIMKHYDIVCPDPRGVGYSTPVKCDADLWASTPSYFVNSEEEWQQVQDFNKALGESCLNLTGPMMGFVDTASAAKDLDALRAAVGDKKFNYLGFSYGTQLGARYAELFPGNIGRMVLDGGVDPSLDELDSFIQGNWAMDNELSRFFEWCDFDSTCALHGSNDSIAIWDALIARANQKPIPAPGCDANSTGQRAGECKPEVTGYELIFELENHFQSPDNWPSISEWIKEADEGNATSLSLGLGSMDYANLAIGCLDNPVESRTYEEHVALQNLGSAMFPHALGSSMQLQFATTCIGWPFNATNPPHHFNSTAGDKLAPILIVNAEHDPATGISEALGLHRQIPNSVFLTRTGDGHTSL